LCKFGLTGSIYRGEWRDGRPQGNGTLFTLPNEIIEARFDGYKIADGQIKILFTNGEFYEGNCKNSMRNAAGVHYYLNGDFYDGEWQMGRRAGRGRIFTKTGIKLQCNFVEDQAEGQVDLEDTSGNVFKSENGQE
jgi:antitoxin component YwqK of YwqJK toxin-antitoxin module